MSKDIKTKPKKEVIEKTSTKKESTLYYFTSTGCAFCKKVDPLVDELNNGDYNILKLDLSDKDNVGLKKELEKEYNIKCGTPLLVDANDGNHICGFRDEETIKKWADGEDIPAPPRPKSPPPVPPTDFKNKELAKKWREDYKKWIEENKHMPLLPAVEETEKRIKKQQEMKKYRANVGAGSVGGNIEGRIRTLEQKIDRLMAHLGVR